MQGRCSGFGLRTQGDPLVYFASPGWLIVSYRHIRGTGNGEGGGVGGERKPTPVVRMRSDLAGLSRRRTEVGLVNEPCVRLR